MLQSLQGPAGLCIRPQLSVPNIPLPPHPSPALPVLKGLGNRTSLILLAGFQLDSTTDKLSHRFFKVEDQEEILLLPTAWAFRDVKFCSSLPIFPGKYHLDVTGSCSLQFQQT